MRIATWNVNSIRARLDRVLAWLDREKPDVACLQEIKVRDDQFPRLEFEALGYRVEAVGQMTYNGVAILAHEDARDVVRALPGDTNDDQARFLAATVGGIRYINVYVPNGKTVEAPEFQFKLAWLDRLRAYLRENEDPTRPLVLCGDFNIAPEDRDVWEPKRFEGKTHCTDEERDRLRSILDWGLRDGLRLWTQEPAVYTWWDYRAGGFWRDQGMRIDHVLITDPIASRLDEVAVQRGERQEKEEESQKPSDHAPVVMTLV
jgi:exodeoxyribonuclease-3